jgi:8-oxo-dGTP pyrophosphatase MutT (NUDIX family)
MAFQELHRRIVFPPPGSVPRGLEVVEIDYKDSQSRQKVILADGAMILPFTVDGDVIAIDEDQPSPAGTLSGLLSCVGAGAIKGETPEQTAQRGLMQKTGYQAGDMLLLTTIVKDLVWVEGNISIFLATDCVKKKEPRADVHLRFVKPADFWNDVIQYFLSDRERLHDGPNTLKVMALAFAQRGLLTCK